MGMLAEMKSNWDVVSGMVRTLKTVGKLEPDSHQLIPDDIEATVDRHRANVAVRFCGEIVTYGELDAQANQVAHWALEQGLTPGDCVALVMENRPDYIAIWYGLSKVGVVTALINNHLTDQALAHCINISDSVRVICGAEQDEAMASVEGLLEGDPQIWTLGGTVSETCHDLGAALERQTTARPSREYRASVRAQDLALYVYTSGTTGLPKAARLPHMRVQGMMRTFIAACKITPADRIYITLPLYHGTGGVCGVGLAVQTGASIILRDRFSATHFWKDAVTYKATAFAYIGELCRYLLNTPECPEEKEHSIRTGFGNGLRPEIWQKFFDRFAIPHLAEFYGSTEGNVSFMNFDGKVGAVGKIPGFASMVYSHVKFVKFDVETEQPLRGEDGFCIECEPDEVGEVIGKIGEGSRQRFEGYKDAEATEKKVLHDVFEAGDMWYRTGDLMRKDAEGYIYFVDRIGDTFRWKGENVSTNEVAEILSQAPGVLTANVYGVAIPGMDGKAGMAAITADGDLDPEALMAFLKERLPAYAVPVFLRRQREAETTGTFKYRKVDLVKDGFDPTDIADPLWFANPETGHYDPLTQDEYETILAGEYRF